MTSGIARLAREGVQRARRRTPRDALQFARSTPGVTTALVGMKSVEHVVENLQLAAVEPTRIEDFLQLFEVDSTE